MDEHRFDDLVRAASLRGSRRSVAGAIVGGLLAAVAPAVAGAEKKKRAKPARRCGKNEDVCGGQCWDACPRGQRRNRQTCACECVRRRCRGGKEFNIETCQCECGDGLKDCGAMCVASDQCCPGERKCSSGGCVPKDACCHDERRCANGTCVPEVGTTCCSGERLCDGRFCIPGDECCFVTERDCPDGSCVAKDACCPNQRKCASGDCIAADACCSDERSCPNGGCIPQDACCPNIEAPCASASGGCCKSAAGEECSDDGCCNTLAGNGVCNGKCIDLETDENCGACGNRCGSCKTCRRDANGVSACVGPDAAPPACQTCIAGEIVSGVSCGDRCCGAGAECCGGGCCAAGKCRVADNGETCCLKVVDNHLICLVM